MRNCDINITLEEALRLLPPPLGEKVKYSVDLIRKSEKIALRYDPEDSFYNTFSGGKDSQVLYHIVKMSGVKFKSHMSLTSIDPPQVIRFVRSEYPDVEMEKPKMSIFQDAIKRKILPTMRIRWCCADFKETAGAGKVTLIGIRAEESSRRAKRHEVEISNKKFSGNIEQFEEYQQEAVAKKMKTLKRKLNEDEFSLVNENEVRCVGGKDSILVSPIFKWTEKDVWTFLNTLGIKHCELYDQGYHRIGCILCPMSQPKQKRREVKDFPHVKRGWIKAIKAIRRGGVQQGQPISPFKDGYLWWNIPRTGTVRNIGGNLRNWERAVTPPHRATSSGSDTMRRTGTAEKCSCPVQFDGNTGRSFCRVF